MRQRIEQIRVCIWCIALGITKKEPIFEEGEELRNHRTMQTQRYLICITHIVIVEVTHKIPALNSKDIQSGIKNTLVRRNKKVKVSGMQGTLLLIHLMWRTPMKISTCPTLKLIPHRHSQNHHH